MRLSLIVAMAENGVIGRDGGLPWHLSNDLRRFKRLTMGHHIIMGRATYESIGRPLPGRTSIVLSRNLALHYPEVRVVGSLAAACDLARSDDEAFVIGGAQIYQLALPHVARVYLTRVHAEIDGDTFFPALQSDQWRTIEESQHNADAKNDFDSTFSVLERVTS